MRTANITYIMITNYKMYLYAPGWENAKLQNIYQQLLMEALLLFLAFYLSDCGLPWGLILKDLLWREAVVSDNTPRQCFLVQ